MTSTLGLKQEQNFTFPRSWDMPEQPGPAGCLPHRLEPVSSQTCARDALFGHSQLTWVPGSTGRRLRSTLPCAHIPLPSTLGNPGPLGCPLPGSPHPIQGDPKQVRCAGGKTGGTSSRVSPDGIHTHPARIPLPK